MRCIIVAAVDKADPKASPSAFSHSFDRFRVMPSAEDLAGKQRRAVAALARHRFG